MISLKELRNDLSNDVIGIFPSKYSKEIQQWHNKEILVNLFGDEIWNSASIRNIHDPVKNGIVSHLINGSDKKQSGVHAFRKEIALAMKEDETFISMLYNHCKNFLEQYHFSSVAIHKYLIGVYETSISKYEEPKLYTYLNNFTKINQDNVFFMWIILGALLQEEITIIIDYVEIEGLRYVSPNDLVYSFLQKNKINIYQENGSGFVANLTEEVFMILRKKMILDANKYLILAGQSLRVAFDKLNNSNIVDELNEAITAKRITQIIILLSDPSVFSTGNNNASPMQDIDFAIENLNNEVVPVCVKYSCKIDIYFIPLLDIDHAVITSTYLAHRSTKLWTKSRRYKGMYALYKNQSQHDSVLFGSEYAAQKEYIDTLISNSTSINLKKDRYNSPETAAMRFHERWRKLFAEYESDLIHLHKLYMSQLVNYINDDWSGNAYKPRFKNSDDICSEADLYNPLNLINDQTQITLLPYIKETEDLFTELIRGYDPRKSSGCKIYPSLNLGYSSNIQRMAGGFTSGMFVTWQSGTDIIPVDATVNTCSSSVFELTDFDVNKLNSFSTYLNNEVFLQASNELGFSFSFTTGNHFLMIARDEDEKYYLVLHSSANEFTHSYVGLCPNDNSWYREKIKTEVNLKTGRYLNYIKDAEARFFIEQAKHMKIYNEQLHKWLAKKINLEVEPKFGIIKHHYYMPTDNSIALGTFVEKPGEIVPIFSNIGKPIYLFRIGTDNWMVRVGDSMCCIVPHGWGEKIESIKTLSVDINRKLFYLNEDAIPIIPQSTIAIRTRDFEDGEEFLRLGRKVIRGNIEKTLYPIYTYSKNENGKIVI